MKQRLRSSESTRALRRNRRARQRLVAGLTAALSALGCNGEHTLEPTHPALHLGEVAGYEKVGHVSKAIVARGSDHAIPVVALPASTLHFAIAALGDDERAAEVTCRVSLTEGDRQGEPIASLELPAGSTGWVDATAAIDAVAAGELRLACRDSEDRPAEAAWAQPVAIPNEASSPAPLIVLISLDTLRADHVDGFGGGLALSPNLGALADEGARLVNATSEGAWTLASHYSLLFSRMYGFPVEPKPLTSLAQGLGDHGFVTAGLTGGGFMGAAFNYHLGFDHYAEYNTGSDDLPRVLGDALPAIERFEAAPTFLFLHSFAVHELPPSEAAWHEKQGRTFAVFRPDAAQLDIARDFYREIVTKTDAEIAPFLDQLREISKRRPVLVVIVSDHGDAFGEHANFRHGFGDPHVTLHDEVIRVPIIVWAPGLVDSGRSIRRPTMLVDVAPSILGAVGAPQPASMRGTDSWGLWARDDAIDGQTPLGGVSHTDGVWSLRGDGSKLIVEMTNRRGRAGAELYDLDSDPGEQNDLAAAQPRRTRAAVLRLRRRLAELGVTVPERGLPRCELCAWQDRDSFWERALGNTAAAGAAAPGEVDEETLQRLRDLGYTD